MLTLGARRVLGAPLLRSALRPRCGSGSAASAGHRRCLSRAAGGSGGAVDGVFSTSLGQWRPAAGVSARVRSGDATLDLPALFPPERVRNFSIIAHIDHGKSTLSDRLLEMTGTIERNELGRGNQQVLDKLQVERERGITVKAQCVTMFVDYRASGTEEWVPYMLNLMDCPGHVDFAYEVSRSLAACQGAVLLIDAAQGLQAQTYSNFFLAFESNLAMVPVLNKVDLPTAEPDRTSEEVSREFDFDEESILRMSAKSGLGVAELVPAVIRRIPPPLQLPAHAAAGADAAASQSAGAATNSKTAVGAPAESGAESGAESETLTATALAAEATKKATEAAEAAAALLAAPFQALLFDSWFEEYRGVCVQVAVKTGRLRVGDRIQLAHDERRRAHYEVGEVGIMHPEMTRVDSLGPGQLGYLLANIKRPADARVGDTVYHANAPVAALPGFREVRHVVFSGLYPASSEDLEKLRGAIDKLTLNDSSVLIQRETSAALGHGFRCGFLGMLHMDVFHTRLNQEYGASVIATAPTVTYRLVTQRTRGHDDPDEDSVVEIATPAAFPDSILPGQYVMEPVAIVTLGCPTSSLGKILGMCDGVFFFFFFFFFSPAVTQVLYHTHTHLYTCV
jgi:small GTP-binding protein